jgi:Ca2+-binding RTX toxin-like protein
MSEFTITSRTTSYYATQSDSVYRMAAGEMIETGDDGIAAEGPMSNLTFEIGGDVRSNSGVAFDGGNGKSISGLSVSIAETGSLYSKFNRGFYASGDGVAVVNHGYISGGTTGFQVHGDDGSLDNTGVILGGEYGIYNYDGGLDLRNTGTIVADINAVYLSGVNAESHIVNEGVIRGKYGIYLSGGEALVDNRGSLISHGIAISLGSQGKVINSGDIVGNVSLSSFDDTFVFKGGDITGKVIGQNGNDTYIVRARGVELFEYADQGGDTVRASVSWTLGDNLDYLTLTGSKNIGGTGNELYNIIDGNGGNNVIRGMGGDDYLTGMGGTNRLFGGAGADTFNFVSKGGKDIVMDFEDGVDHFDMFYAKGLDSFGDLRKNHLKVVGDDLVITADRETIVIRDTAKSELDPSDFSF